MSDVYGTAHLLWWLDGKGRLLPCGAKYARLPVRIDGVTWGAVPYNATTQAQLVDCIACLEWLRDYIETRIDDIRGYQL